MKKVQLEAKIKELEENLRIQINNNKILNQRNQNLQKEVIQYQKEIQELGKIKKNSKK